MQKLSFEQVSAFFDWKCKNPPGLKKSKKCAKNGHFGCSIYSRLIKEIL